MHLKSFKFINQAYNLNLNISIKFSHFLKGCKIAKLKPLYKKGTKTDRKNFRPISKVIEKAIHN